MAEYLIITVIIISVLIALALIRIAFSKNIPERIVALDTINTLIIIILVSLGAAFGNALYIDIAIVYGLLSFIGTLFVARYLKEAKSK